MGGVRMKHVKYVKWAYSILAATLVAVGVVFIGWPGTALSLIEKICGFILLIFGIVKLFGYFSGDLFQLAFQFDLALGIVSGIIGFVMLFHTEQMIEVMAACIGVFLLLDAALKIQTAFDSRKFGIERWWMILIAAVISAVIGALALIMPFKGANLIVRLIGLNLCMEGVLNVLVVQSTVKTIKNRKDGMKV